MTRTPLAAALAVTAVALTASLSACSGAGGTQGASTPAASVNASHRASGGASGSTGGAVYVTGAETADDPCARVVSAIGYLGLSLLPPGREDAQHWDGDVRGRFGYLRGTLEMYATRLPRKTSGAASDIDRVAGLLSQADTGASRRPGLLRVYRKASGTITAACGAS
ncbi:hypothetical protein [Microbispora sp. NPDC049125]|uniref:hypothetical protein n=1 Tax=Microbispora sp. NPDC049125 TaxID=3154929 RepID=UPI0034676BBA